jgi:hypothetical protein
MPFRSIDSDRGKERRARGGTEVRGQRSEVSKNQRTDDRWQIKSRERGAGSKEQGAKSREQRAGSGEHLSSLPVAAGAARAKKHGARGRKSTSFEERYA